MFISLRRKLHLTCVTIGGTKTSKYWSWEKLFHDKSGEQYLECRSSLSCDKRSCEDIFRFEHKSARKEQAKKIKNWKICDKTMAAGSCELNQLDYSGSAEPSESKEGDSLQTQGLITQTFSWKGEVHVKQTVLPSSLLSLVTETVRSQLSNDMNKDKFIEQLMSGPPPPPACNTIDDKRYEETLENQSFSDGESLNVFPEEVSCSAVSAASACPPATDLPCEDSGFIDSTLLDNSLADQVIVSKSATDLNTAGMPTTSQTKKNKKRDKKSKKLSGEEDSKMKKVKKKLASDDKGDRSNEEMKRTVPNYFVAIQITNKEIHESLKKVQDSVVAENKLLKQALIPLPTLHITLMVMHLSNEEEITRAKKALEDSVHMLQPLYVSELLELEINKLGDFSKKVLFAKIDPGDQFDELLTIAEVTEKCFNKHSIVTTDKKSSFSPHLTIMKLSKVRQSKHRKVLKRIDPKYYEDYANTYFGRQTVLGLQLCSMTKKAQESGYYHVSHQLDFAAPADSKSGTTTPTTSLSEALVDQAIFNSLEQMEEEADRKDAEQCYSVIKKLILERRVYKALRHIKKVHAPDEVKATDIDDNSGNTDEESETLPQSQDHVEDNGSEIEYNSKKNNPKVTVLHKLDEDKSPDGIDVTVRKEIGEHSSVVADVFHESEKQKLYKSDGTDVNVKSKVSSKTEVLHEIDDDRASRVLGETELDMNNENNSAKGESALGVHKESFVEIDKTEADDSMENSSRTDIHHIDNNDVVVVGAEVDGHSTDACTRAEILSKSEEQQLLGGVEWDDSSENIRPKDV